MGRREKQEVVANNEAVFRVARRRDGRIILRAAGAVTVDCFAGPVDLFPAELIGRQVSADEWIRACGRTSWPVNTEVAAELRVLSCCAMLFVSLPRSRRRSSGSAVRKRFSDPLTVKAT